MPFRIHLLIISFIIMSVYIAWHIMGDTPAAPAPIAAEPQKSALNIQVIHATWGDNCRHLAKTVAATPYDAFVGDNRTATDKLKDDNVLERISQYCNDKPQCDIAVGPEILGEDPMPECRDKVLRVEYRCFSYDRPWSVRSSGGKLFINCDKAR